MNQKASFRSTTGVPIHVALTSGHAVVVPPEGKPIHPRFHRKAVELGCLPAGAEAHEQGPAPTGDRSQVLSEGLRTMLDSDDPAMFTAQNQPNLNKLSRIVGFRVEREEVAPVWAMIEAELRGEGDGEGDEDTEETGNQGEGNDGPANGAGEGDSNGDSKE